MGYIISVVLFLVALNSKKKRKSWIAPEVLFCMLWSLISFAASLRLFGLLEVSNRTWIVILVGVLSFAFGSRINIVTDYKENTTNEHENGIISKRFFYFLSFVILIVSLYRLFATAALLNDGYSMAMIRAGIENTIFDYSNLSFISNFLDYVRNAIEILVVASGIEFYFTENKKRLLYMVISIIVTINSALTDGGRWVIVYFLIDFFVCYILYKNKSKDRKKENRYIMLFIMAFMLISVIFVTKSRMIGNLLEHFYSYFCCCIPLLDIKSSMIVRNDIISLFLSGQWGLWSVVLPVIQKIFGLSLSFYDFVANNVIIGQEYEFVGTGLYNAFVSAFYYLYADFRILGVFIGMLIFGIISQRCFKYAENNTRGGSCVPYMIMCQLFIKSIQGYFLTSTVYVIVLLLILLAKRIKISFNK